jgi:hypothetical protein
MRADQYRLKMANLLTELDFDISEKNTYKTCNEAALVKYLV